MQEKCGRRVADANLNILLSYFILFFLYFEDVDFVIISDYFYF